VCSAREVKDGAVVRARQSCIEPVEKFARGTEGRNAAVFDGRKNRRTYENLAARIALAFSASGARGETTARSA
jgi:hypothetical protein